MKKSKLIAALTMMMVLGVASGCDDDNPYYVEVDYSKLADWVDYAANLSMPDEIYNNYQNASFLTDGYGQVDLVRKIDGDTAHFYPHNTSSSLIKSRYNCIDTPESTGVVEEWGSGASACNGEYLANAKVIVLSTDSTDATSGPAIDSTGGRYLTYIWTSSVENPSASDFTLVNLALTQYGWSKAKGVSGTDFASYFEDADAQAKKYELHVWSDKLDPDFNYESSKIGTLQMIIDAKDADGNDFLDEDGNNNWIGHKISFPAFVTATGPDTGAATLSRDFEVDGETVRYAIYVFTSYREYAPLATIGNEVNVTGLVSEYNGNLQLVGVSYSAAYPSDDDMYIVTDEDGTVHNAAWTAENYPSILEPIEVSGSGEDIVSSGIMTGNIVTANLKITGGYATQSTTSTAWSFTLYCNDYETGNEGLNVYVVDGIAIYPAGYNSGRISTTDSDGDGFVYGDDAVAGFTNGVEYITVTGIFTLYTSSSGTQSYQIQLCSRTGLEFHVHDDYFTLSPSSVIVPVGETTTVTATYLNDSSYSGEITWTVPEDSLIELATSDNGKSLSITAGETTGTTTLVGTGNLGYQAKLSVTVY